MSVVKALLLLFVVAVVANNFGMRTSVTSLTGFLYTFQEGQMDQSVMTTSSGGFPGMGPITLSGSPSNWWSWSAQQQGLYFSPQTVPGSTMYNGGISQNRMSQSTFWSNFYNRATAPNDTTFTFDMWLKSDGPTSVDSIFAAIADFESWNGFLDAGTTTCNINTGRAVNLRWHQSSSSNAYPNKVDFTAYQTNGAGTGAQCFDPLTSGNDFTAQPDFTAAPTYVAIRKSPSSPVGTNTYTLTVRNTLGSYSANIAVSGTQLPQPFDWRNSKLNLVHGFTSQTTWAGSIYMLGFYTRALTNGEIDTNYGAGPPNSLPYNKIQEYVEGFQEVPFSFTLNMTDADSDTLTFTILSPPLYGKLYAGPTNSSSVLVNHVNYVVPANGRVLTYQGDFLGYGFPYTSFQYKASDNFGDSQIVTVNININRVNKPPIAFDSVQYVRSASYAVVYLNGSDIDHSLGPLRPQFVSKSANVNAVYQYPGQDPIVCLPLGCSLGSALTTGVDITDPLHRVVVQMSAMCTNSGQAIQGSENIKFIFVDGDGGMSPFPGTATLQVLNHLEAVAETVYGVMDIPAIFTLRARDWSVLPSMAPSINTNNEVFINRLPSYGVASAVGGGNFTSVPTAVLSLYKFGYRGFMFWAGNDTLNFTARALTSTCGSTWKSAPSLLTLNIRPLLYAPELDPTSMDYSAPVALVERGTATFRLGIIEHTEPYLSPNDLYFLFFQPLNSGVDGGLLTVTCDQTPAGVVNDFGDHQNTGFLAEASPGSDNGAPHGDHDQAMSVIAPLYMLRGLVSGPVGAATSPALPFITANTGFLALRMVPWIAFVCAAKDTIRVTGLTRCPPGASNVTVTFAVSPAGGLNGGGTLPIPALVFAWIGIGLVALLCYGCLAWRWWKNRKLQQRTRTNMAAGANASKYLHSL